ncbi:hypothetical protein SAMN05421774_11252 [Gemmobacter megaterium]|uniref:Tail terminator n=1 Tax=Gemmobacter megaterium TaxID=1086013 RepID=A0A1N7QIW7_9RHOB|nr:hypothetical protein [Gemmobacter megaterium]GGE26625.1 hypothetical protein GCM10011345_35760 [Gemmobacter megaterium]SIT22729.1 hypothetical protein SAMN05421774_11252 [Gemmobacter megaterium]
MTWRAGYRSAARAALAAVPRFADMTVLATWSGSVDPETLPVLGVVTASEQQQPTSGGRFEHDTLLQIIVKRQGGDDLEDELDADDAAIIQAVMGAIYTRETPCLPTDMSQMLNGEGRQRIGTLVRSFKITSWRAAPVY